MAKFITGKALEDAVYNIIWEAEETLLIVSPFIRLDNYFKTLFDKHCDNYKIHLIVVFGKNEGEVSRSLSKSDFDYFKKFPNISIVYVPNLHAKYYGNERKGVITSINLYDYSFINNIEFGVYSETNLMNSLTSSPDQEAWKKCLEIAEESEAVFIKRPVYQKKMLSAILGNSYIKSDILHDTTDKFYSSNSYKGNLNNVKKISDFPNQILSESASSARPSREDIENSAKPYQETKSTIKKTGYCIRTGVEIKFNIEKPLSYDAFKKWNIHGNEDFPEKFCHFSGEPSKGETSVKKPILSKNWKKAKEIFNL
jgi:hypothetical protein